MGQFYQNPTYWVRRDTYYDSEVKDWDGTSEAVRYAAYDWVMTRANSAQSLLSKTVTGVWEPGSAIVCGVDIVNVSDGYYLHLGEYDFRAEASAYGNSGAFKFDIPAAPEGSVRSYAIIKLYADGELYSEATVTAPINEGVSFIYELPLLMGGTVPDTSLPRAPYTYINLTWDGYHKHFSASLEIWYDDIAPINPDCVDIISGSITDTGAILTGASATHWQWGIEGDDIGEESETGILADLTPDTNYWYKALAYCTTKKFWFKTKKYEDPETHNIQVFTLGVDDWWWMGGGQGTVRGLIKHTGNANFYGYFGFQFGTSSTFTSANTVWLGNQGSESSSWVPPDPWLWPYQHTYNHLLPDRTYYYRAVWHHGRPPMTVDLYGATLSFAGVSSIMGLGTNHITAKKAEDDISKLAAGRYYMDKSGVFQYESYQRRLA
jgi:hypothetical protein